MSNKKLKSIWQNRQEDPSIEILEDGSLNWIDDDNSIKDLIYIIEELAKDYSLQIKINKTLKEKFKK